MADSQSLTDRMIRAAKLDVDLYEEVEADTSANGQAFKAVIVASVATGIGAGLYGSWDGGVSGFVWGLVLGLLASIVGWLLWSLFAYVIGTTIFKGPETSATYGELLRTIGFSNSPRVLNILSFIPILGLLVVFVTAIWSLIAGVIAVRQALDFSTIRAILTCIVGWIIYSVLVGVVMGILS